ncbi:MAG: histidine ammonia-lyase [Hyphomicrobiales bacterium]|nr:histidine ammonia-lyase [Hyphomicrobiales bacterium]
MALKGPEASRHLRAEAPPISAPVDDCRIGTHGLGIAEIVAVARQGARVEIAPELHAKLKTARVAIERAAARGDMVYGLTTALGAAVDTSLEAADLADFQRRTLRARMVGVGDPLPKEATRALLIARLAGLVPGASGLSPPVAQAIADLLNAGVTPVVPRLGSVGAADLAPLAHAFAVLIGEGEAEFEGRVLTGAEALVAAGLSPVVLRPKDAIALINSNALSVGPGALVIADAELALDALTGALALSLEAFRGNPSPIDPRAVALRPAPGLVAIAQRLRELLAGSGLEKPGAARRVQDPLSFRSGAPILAALSDALARARAAVELELRGAGDNPAIVDDNGTILSTAGFDVTHLSLAFETLGLALTQAAGASFWRIVKLMNAAMTGLPRFLTPRGASRTGFGTVQKTAASLEAEIRRLAQPAMLFTGPVADGIEDMASMAPRVVAKTAEAFDHVARLAAVELIVAAQALELRSPARIAPGTAALKAKIRSVVPGLDEDRPTGRDIEALAREIRAGGLQK